MWTDSERSSLAVAADEGLKRLMEGNQRFVRGEAHFLTVCKETLADLARGQKPFATILGCSDSRVPPELIFDANFGELFIVRVAGNVFSPEVAGSLQYAGAHLRTPLFMVLGHEGCGAVKAALQYKRTGVEDRARIQVLLNNILPGLSDFSDLDNSGEDALPRAIEANVRWSLHQILSTPEGKNATNLGARFVGAVYEIASGRVRLLGV